MESTYLFEYFPEYHKWARFEEDCECEDGSPCLDGVFFGDPDIEEPVCLSDLVSGKVRVDIPDYVVDELRDSITETRPDLTNTQITEKVQAATDTLARTPPVPWIQNNEWPSHCGDFCRYLGEWNQERLNNVAEEGNGRAFLWSILIPAHRARRNLDELWEEIENEWAAIYVFECRTCGKLVALEQSY